MLRKILLLSSLLLFPTLAYSQVTIVPSRSISTGGGGGSVNGPASAIDNDFVCWDGTAGTLVKDCGKTLTDFLSSSVTSVQDAHHGDLYLKDDVNPSHYLKITAAEDLTAQRTLSIITGDADRSITFTGNVSLSGTLSGTATGSNTGDVTLSGAQGFITISGQALTKHNIVDADIDSAAAITISKFAAIANNRILANVSGGSSAASANTLTAVMDILCTTQGAVIFRDAASWSCLTPGSSGQVLATQGAAANPHWITASGTGTVNVHGTPTANHVATWFDATTIQDGGVLPSFTPSGIDTLIYYQNSDTSFHELTLLNGLVLTNGSPGSLGLNNLTLPTGGAVRTATSAGNTLLLQAYNTNTTTYTTFGTLTANNPPTFDLATNTTYNGATILNASNTVTVTNKSIVIQREVKYMAGVSQNGTAGYAFDSCHTTGVPVAHEENGTNTHYTSLDMATNACIQGHFQLPNQTGSVWTGAVDVYGIWKTSATTNTATLRIKSNCVADGESFDTALGNSDNVTLTPNGSASSRSSFSKTGLTTTGCAAGEDYMWQADISANTLGVDAFLVEITFVYRVTILTGS